MEKLINNKLEEQYNKLVKSELILPIKVTDFYKKKIEQEVERIGIGGPLYKSVIPIQEKISVKTSIETRDYVEENKHMPVEGVDYIIRKYQDRLILIITDVCFSHCQYCFRTYNLSKLQESSLKETIRNKIMTLKKYLLEHKEVKEIIFSGGDPLSIGYDNMSYALKELKEWNIRIHTRAIVYEPEVFNEDMIQLLKRYDVRLVFHINHPYEICEIVENKIKWLYNNNVRLYAQFPLLRGINDNYIVLRKLLTKMDELHIRPLSIFIPDPIAYSACFRISFKRIIQIMNELNWNTPSWINSIRFVMDTTIGKVRYENIKNWEKNCITFSRDGKDVKYYDLDDGIDIPSDINKLLWKENF